GSHLKTYNNPRPVRPDFRYLNHQPRFISNDKFIATLLPGTVKLSPPKIAAFMSITALTR
ncbi:hypothetical protein MJN47_29210, partial [Salmonella enterica subsp. enterica serovar Lubbock]|nr:hypothetical protein [Salmonella enterica subsp. enterica serovar Lubbock]